MGVFTRTASESCRQDDNAARKPAGSRRPLERLGEALVLKWERVRFRSPRFLQTTRGSRIHESNLGNRGGGGGRQGSIVKETKPVSNSIFSNSRGLKARSSGGTTHLPASGGFALRPRGAAVQLTVDGVGVLAPAAWPVDPVVAAPAQLQAALGGRVTQQAREEQRQGSHAQVPRAAVRLGAGAGVVGVRVPRVVVGAVVEDALDQAHAAAVLHHALGRAQALPVAGQAGRQGPRRRALGALALPAPFTDELVLRQLLLQGALQVIHDQLLGLGPDRPFRPMSRDRSAGRRPPQQPLLGGGAAVAPRTGRASGAGRSAQNGASGMMGETRVSQVAGRRSGLAVIVHINRYDFVSPFVLFLSWCCSRRGSFHHGRPFRVFIAAPDGLELVQGQNSSRLNVSLIVRPLPTLQRRLLDHH